MYKNRRMVVAITAVLAAVFVASCAVQKNDPTEHFAKESFHAWMKKYDPMAEQKPSGVYIRYVERDANWSQLPAPVLNKSWLSLNYDGYTLGHNIFETRSSYLAQLVGIWAATTHFVPDFLAYTSSAQLCKGLIDALSYMRKGDSVRIYIPTSLAYVSSMSANSGYSNQTTYANYPVYFDMRLCDIIDDPKTWELERLKAYALSQGFDIKKDSLEEGIYMRITDARPLGDTITEDSTIRYWQSRYFFDDQLAGTNIKSVAREAGYYSESIKYDSTELTRTNFTATTGTYLVYPKVVLKMRKGETAEAIAASWWGPGAFGAVAEKPQLLPYQSMRYVISVIDTTKKK